LRGQGPGEALHARGGIASERADRAAGEAGAVHGPGDRGTLSRARRRDGAQARGPSPAHAPGRDGPDRLAAALRRLGPARTRGSAGATPGGADRDPVVRLLLARHGESVWNAERRFQGRTDIPLSARGRAQAEALGQGLRGYRVRAAYGSPYRRGVETAELALLASGVPLTVLPELRELSLGQWEGCTVDDVRAQDGDPYRAWLRAPHDCPPPDREPRPDVRSR